MASERTWLTEVLARTPQEHLDRHEAPISHKFLRLEPAAPATTATAPTPREESSSSSAASSSAEAPAAATTEGDSEGAAQSTSEQGEGLASSANRPKREAPRGKNKRLSKKQRRAEAHAMLQSELCTNVAQGRECTRAKCVASHDLQDYLSKREPDLSAFPCPQVAELGYCWLGFKCRFLSSHLSADGKLVFPTPMPERRDIYVLDQTTVIALRKRKHRFPRTSAAIAAIAQNERAAGARQPAPTTPTATADAAAATTTTNATTPAAATTDSSTVAAPATDDATPTTTAAAATTTTETVQQPVDSSTSSSSSSSSAASAAASSSDAVVSASSETTARASLLLDDDGARVPKKQIDWRGKLILAPLTTIGNLPYRRICKQFGADITVSEMALASKILETSAAELALLKRHPSEDIFGVQLAGRTGQQVAEAIELLRDHSSVTADFFDINAGCPIDLVFNQGMGSALCARPQQRMRNILQAASAVSDVPVTVKIRMGVHTGEPNAHTYIASLGDWGASAVTLHGRSRQARYSMRADWDYIGQCAKIATIPLIGNGDVYNWEDAVHHLENSASALLVARGGIIKPWLFREIKERKHIDISASERLDIVKEFSQYGLLHWGSDARGVDTTRRFLLEWLSFLHRYIPVGLLDVLPSKIAHRIPTQWGFYGRSDLETKMASANPIDWIQISEMFLGPVADGYSFTPKHRAEAYTRIDNRSNLASSSSSTGEPQPIEEDYEEVQG